MPKYQPFNIKRIQDFYLNEGYNHKLAWNKQPKK